MTRGLIAGLIAGILLAIASPAAVADWDKTFGGPDWDEGYSLQKTTDGGYIIAGNTSSYGAGGPDIWLIKTDSGGNEQWNRTFGGPSYDGGNGVQQTADGGYVVVGSTRSYGAGDYDVWLIKTDAGGTREWDTTFGGTGSDDGYSVRQTTDGGYVIAGSTESYGAGDFDAWLIKTDAVGTMQWDKTFGGPGWDEGACVQQTTDGGYIIAGYTGDSYTGDWDVWLIKTDANGNAPLP